MTNNRTIDAAISARREDDELTEIAQIGPGNAAKAREMMVNENVPSSLRAAFQSAADSAADAERLQTFNLLQQQKIEVQQQQAKEKKQKEAHDSWLDSMSPEYQQAYNHLMTTVDNADTQYDRLRERLKQRGDALDRDARDIDDNAIHLSDNSRAYLNAEGILVDKNGIPLKANAAAEANTLARQHNGPISTCANYQQNQQSRADVSSLSQRVDSEENEANKFRQDVADHKVPGTEKVKQGDSEIQRKLTATEAAATVDSHESKINQVSLAGLSDLDGDSAQSAATADRGSFASHVDQGAGIKASSLTAPFNTATKGPPAPPPAIAPSQKPTVSGPSPA